jgi:hypothetical protein
MVQSKHDSVSNPLKIVAYASLATFAIYVFLPSFGLDGDKRSIAKKWIDKLTGNDPFPKVPKVGNYSQQNPLTGDKDKLDVKLNNDQENQPKPSGLSEGRPNTDKNPRYLTYGTVPPPKSPRKSIADLIRAI